MHRAILIPSRYPATSGYPNHACWEETSERLMARLAQQGYEVESLTSGSGLVQRLRSSLRREDKQASLLLHFCGYLLLTESGDPALLLADESVTALRLRQLVERAARRFGRVLIVVDAVRGSSTRTIAQASGDSRHLPEEALARMALSCAEQVDNVSLFVGVRPWGDDDGDSAQLSSQLHQALRQLAAVPDWHTSHELEEWLEEHADSAGFTLRTHHCDPAFVLLPRRPFPSSPHAPPLPPTLGPSNEAVETSTSLDELAAMIREPQSPPAAETKTPHAAPPVLPAIPPPAVAVPRDGTTTPPAANAAPPAEVPSPSVRPSGATVTAASPSALVPPEPPVLAPPPKLVPPAGPGPSESASPPDSAPPSEVAPPPVLAPSGELPAPSAVPSLPPEPHAPPAVPAAPPAVPPVPPAAVPSLPPAPPSVPAAAPSVPPASPIVAPAVPALPPEPPAPPIVARGATTPAPEAPAAGFGQTMPSVPALDASASAPPVVPTAAAPPIAASPVLPLSQQAPEGASVERTAITEPLETTGADWGQTATQPVPTVESLAAAAPLHAPGDGRGAGSERDLRLPPPLPLERAASLDAGGPPPLPAERAAASKSTAAGDTYVSAQDPVPPAAPLPIAIGVSTPAGANAASSAILPQRTVALNPATGGMAPLPPLPPTQHSPGAHLPPPPSAKPPGRTQASAGTPPSAAPLTSAKTTPVVVVSPPSAPMPPPMANTMEAPAPSIPSARPPSLPPQVASPESWPPDARASMAPSRDEAALVANAQRALAKGQSEEALRLAEACLSHFPHSVPAMQLAATELARLGRWARLADLYERVIGQLHDPAGAAQLCGALARICVAQLNDPQRAQQAILRGLARQPNHPALLGELASEEERQGNWKPAAEHSRQALRSAPLNPRLCRDALRRFQQTGQLELAWSAACILGYLGQASERERQLVNTRRSGNLPQPTRALSGSDFQLGLSPIAPSAPLNQVLTRLYAPLRLAAVAKPKQQQQLLATLAQENVKQSTTTLARTFAWSCQLLDVAPPALYLTAGDALPTMLNVEQPAWCVGRGIGRGLTLRELVFLWARALIRTRPESRIATCTRSVSELKDAVEAAALLAGVTTHVSAAAKKLSKTLKKCSERSLWTELRGPLQAVVGSSIDEALLRWWEELERAGNRLGLLACGDPELAARTLERYVDESVLGRQAQLTDLLGFTMSSEYETLTTRLGLRLG